MPLEGKKKYNTFCDRSCAASHNNKTPGRKHGPTAVKAKPPRRVYRTAQEGRLCSREAFARSRARNHYNVEIGDYTELRKFYMACPDGYEVDHIVPMFAGGPHTTANLQYLTPTDNKAKHRLDIDKYGALWCGRKDSNLH